MTHSSFAEITGTLTAPALPSHLNGAPRITLSVSAGGTEQLYWSAQASHTPMPFRFHLDTLALPADARVWIEAACTEGTGATETVATSKVPLSLAGTPLALLLEAEGLPAAASGEADPLELAGNISIPDALYQPNAWLSIVVLVIQKDGQSNLFASNLAETVITRPRQTLPFALTLDRATLPEGHRVKLRIALQNEDGSEAYAGKVVKDIDLFGELPDLSEIVLKGRRG